MDWNELFREGEQLVSERRISEAIEHYKGIMEKAENDQKIYYWALKHIGDVIGHGGMRDYLQAIDIYQRIINEYEAEDDPLYNWCQLDIARAYLEMGLEMMHNFDNMGEIIEVENEEMDKYLQKLVEKRNDYIEREAEVIYKGRM